MKGMAVAEHARRRAGLAQVAARLRSGAVAFPAGDPRLSETLPATKGALHTTAAITELRGKQELVRAASGGDQSSNQCGREVVYQRERSRWRLHKQQTNTALRSSKRSVCPPAVQVQPTA